MTVQAGDLVTFHMLDAHYCGGIDCACIPNHALPAIVVEVLPIETTEPSVKALPDGSTVVIPGVVLPQCLVLDVEFHDEDVTNREFKHPNNGCVTTLHRLGYLGRQSASPAAQTYPPESGSWTMPHDPDFEARRKAWEAKRLRKFTTGHMV